MSDTITIEEIACQTHIGVTEEERTISQKILVSVEMYTDLRRAGASDDLKDTINYSHVAGRIQILAKEERKTIEKFADDIARMILREFHPEKVRVKVDKFALKGAKSTSVTIERS
jgi:FolB domain-containing protein